MYWTVHLQGGPKRVNHAAVAVGKYIYSFGGYCTCEDYNMRGSIDVHMLDTDTLRWTKIESTAKCESAMPFQRYGHTVIEFNGKIYLLGGRNDYRSSDKLHCFNVEEREWTLPRVSGLSPRAIDGHTSCVIGDYMYVWGGYEEETEWFAETLHRINLVTFVWEDIIPSGIPPQSTDFHTASAVGDRMYLFGGRGTLDDENREEIYENKIIYLDTTEMKWVTPETHGKAPDGRRSHSAVVYENEIYILCGFNSTLKEHFSDIHRFNPRTNSWSEVKCKGEGPNARRRQCCCIVDDRLFLFGGTSPKSYDEDDHIYALQEDDYDDFHKLSDHSDLFVLDFFPSLKMLCLLKVISFRMAYTWLPPIIRREISCMTTDNYPAKKALCCRRGFSYSATTA